MHVYYVVYCSLPALRCLGHRGGPRLRWSFGVFAYWTGNPCGLTSHGFGSALSSRWWSTVIAIVIVALLIDCCRWSFVLLLLFRVECLYAYSLCSLQRCLFISEVLNIWIRYLDFIDWLILHLLTSNLLFIFKFNLSFAVLTLLV